MDNNTIYKDEYIGGLSKAQITLSNVYFSESFKLLVVCAHYEIYSLKIKNLSELKERDCYYVCSFMPKNEEEKQSFNEYLFLSKLEMVLNLDSIISSYMFDLKGDVVTKDNLLRMVNSSPSETIFFIAHPHLMKPEYQHTSKRMIKTTLDKF